MAWRNNDGPRAKCDQVIYEAIAKASEIIVASRGPIPNGSGSSRFNLQVPGIPRVRSILQEYRMTLHVPIRLDVYYQHEDDRRELLERWCLEYKPASTERFIQAEGIVSQDPLAQLRHVCKRLVLWLRTLYCWTRLLPTQALMGSSKPPLGFAIYVNPEGADDLTDLTQNQGFRWQAQPSPVVSPYGELGWQVLYSPAIEHLKRAQYSRPIPQPRAETPKTNDTHVAMPQSAPAKYNHLMAPRSMGAALNMNRAVDLRNTQQQTYDPSRFVQRSQSQKPTTALNVKGLPQRRHTSIGDSSDVPPATCCPQKEDTPERVMSGLSLAMMTAEEESKTTTEPSLSEKRHAALHEVPQHVLEQQQLQQQMSGDNKSAPAASEYGYAYNNHIRWQTIQPSANPSMLRRDSSDGGDVHDNSFRKLTSSPGLLATTPPTCAFGMTPPSGAALDPPRSAITPPFQSRPIGFIQEAPFAPSFGKGNTSTKPSGSLKKLQSASLDLLHSSPFEQSLTASQAILGAPGGEGSILQGSNADLRRSLWASSSGAPFQSQAEELDMPFAVESTPASSSVAGASSALATPQVVASFAQQCTPQNTLGAFSQPQKNSASVEDLVKQLADFRNFGASLQASGSESNSSATPIPLRS